MPLLQWLPWLQVSTRGMCVKIEYCQYFTCQTSVLFHRGLSLMLHSLLALYIGGAVVVIVIYWGLRMIEKLFRTRASFTLTS